ncbi:fgf [Adoxophyes orana granulovirus]|uniref:Fgf n=1 Tax=Adoxophyes orana granulovirus TaxID=170617 RepID=Q91B76_GVAO|nr:fgf [Adoxophyes orana granulovirus]AAL02079.1 unknown [Adoxophyes orana granulovirus]AAP85754.1 fgf [Adoxophyes orana granulovirus]AJA91759.1 fibroblast growth factor 3 [Adoxophyes orana granulovirus]
MKITTISIVLCIFKWVIMAEEIDGSGDSIILMLDKNDEIKNEDDMQYDYVANIIQLYNRINEQDVYLDASNWEVNQYIPNGVNYRFLNLIQYTLDKKELWHDDDNQVVLQHEISSYYLCANNCGGLYMSKTFTTDCIFIRELIQDISSNLQKIFLKKRFSTNGLFNLRLDYGIFNFDLDSSLYSVNIMHDRETVIRNLSPLKDEAIKTKCEPKETDDEIENEDDDTLDDTLRLDVESALVSWYLIALCVIISVILISILLIVFVVCKHHVKYKL